MSPTRERLRISELAEEAGVPVATVRHYLREGLLPEGEKTSRNMAYYPPELVERIRLIKQLQEERFLPLKVIGELLRSEGGDLERISARLDVSAAVLEMAGKEHGERLTADELAARHGVPAEAVGRLAELGVIGPPDEHGFGPSDERIVEAISRFREVGYDEEVGFTVRETARFLEPLERLAEREVELLADKVVGRFEPDRALAMVEAGVEPLHALVAAMHSKLLLRELSRRRGGEPTA